jgi:hypothetical protein
MSARTWGGVPSKNESGYPTLMLEFLQGKASDRNLRLFASACCRRISHLIVHPVSQASVDVAERFPDGLATDGERDRIYGEMDDVRRLLGVAGTDPEGVGESYPSGSFPQTFSWAEEDLAQAAQRSQASTCINSSHPGLPVEANLTHSKKWFEGPMYSDKKDT